MSGLGVELCVGAFEKHPCLRVEEEACTWARPKSSERNLEGHTKQRPS